MTKEEYNDLRKRNKNIYDMRMRGMSSVDIAKKYGITRARVNEIIAQEKRYILLSDDEKELMRAINSLPLVHYSTTRIYQALRRLGIDSLAELRKYPASVLLNKKNFGEKSVTTLMEAGLIESEII